MCITGAQKKWHPVISNRFGCHKRKANNHRVFPHPPRGSPLVPPLKLSTHDTSTRQEERGKKERQDRGRKNKQRRATFSVRSSKQDGSAPTIEHHRCFFPPFGSGEVTPELRGPFYQQDRQDTTFFYFWPQKSHSNRPSDSFRPLLARRYTGPRNTQKGLYLPLSLFSFFFEETTRFTTPSFVALASFVLLFSTHRASDAQSDPSPRATFPTSQQGVRSRGASSHPTLR